MEIKIRSIENNDYEDIAKIYSYESVINQTSQLPHGNADFWKGFYGSKANGSIELVAECDGKPVAHLGILMSQAPRRRHAASFGIAVHPDYQGKGVGAALLEEMIRLADNWLDLLKLELTVFTDNKIAVELYKKYDFVIEGTSRYDTFKQGKYCDSYKMSRLHPRIRSVSQTSSGLDQ